MALTRCSSPRTTRGRAIRSGRWLALLVALAPAGLAAQELPPPDVPVELDDGRLAFRYLTVADGLSQNAVQAILQDRRGFMWFGTKDGLNRYDGRAFVVHRHDPFDPTTISDSDIRALYEDARGRIWIGTRGGGLSRYDPVRDLFRRYPSGPSEVISSLSGDASGALWIGTSGEGLYRLTAAEADRETPVFDRFRHDPGDPRSLSDDRVHSVLVDRNGTLWVGTALGLNRLDGAASIRPGAGFLRYATEPGDARGIIDARVNSLYEDSAGRLWVGSVPGVSVLDPNRSRIAHHYHRYRTERYGWGSVVDILEGSSGQIWLATRAELMSLDPETGDIRYHRHDPETSGGINSDSPNCLYRDRGGLLWVGTNGFGLNVHDPGAERFHTFRRPRGRDYSQPGFSVYTLFEDSRGAVWISAGVLYRWDRRAGTFVSLESPSLRPEVFGNTGGWGIVEDPPGFLWVGSYEGLYHHEIATGRTRRYHHEPEKPGSLPEREVKDVLVDREGAVWAVTQNYLARLDDPEAGLFTSYRFGQEREVGAWLFPSIHQDQEGAFWLGSNDGLVRFDPEIESFRRYRNDPADRASLSHDVVRAIHPDPRRPERYLWIGTAGGGLNRLDVRTGRFTHVTVEDGLPNNVIYGILADGAGRLWLSTNRGLARYDPVSGDVRSYDADSGLQSDEFNSGAAFRSASGELFFGGIYGFNHFHPEEIEENPVVPPVVLTALKRGNRYESVRDSGSVLSRTVTEADTVRLSYRDEVVSFEFAALDFTAPSKNRYAYRMEGLNEEWVEAGNARSATYTSLPPGDYTFRVRGSNSDGVWNEEGASLAVLVAPPWWGTWWAYALYALLAAAGLYALRSYEMNLIRLENRLEIEQLESGQLRELDTARSRFFANVSHEFRTPLTLTLGPLDDVLAGLHGTISAAAREQVELARRNAARVLALIDQILEVARLEDGRTSLRARPLDLADVVRELGQSFAPLAERRRLELLVRVPDEPVTVWADPEKLERILSNLLSNAMKFTPAGGTVGLRVEGDASGARVEVRDTGPGIAPEHLPHVFDRFYRADPGTGFGEPGTGIGLALARELAELHGGEITVESEQGFGTAFTVHLRRGREHLTPEQVAAPDSGTSREAEEATAGVPRTPLAPALQRPNGPRPGGGNGVGRSGPREEGATPPPPEDGDRTTVLVVEDNPDVRAYVRSHLAGRYRVLEAADGAEGLATAREALPDLVLSDVMMPGLDGHELCRALKADPETDFIPVVLLTARAGSEDRLTGLEAHADDYLTKPFRVEELLARVENLIASRKRLRDRYLSGSGPELDPARELHPAPVQVEGADERFLRRVREAVEAHLGDEEFTVARLAREVAHSRSHLHRRLRELTDEAPSELIRRMRLERAAQLLEADAGSVGEIAYAVGFKSVSHFSNSFLDHHGVRPSAYRGGPEATAAPPRDD